MFEDMISSVLKIFSLDKLFFLYWGGRGWTQWSYLNLKKKKTVEKKIQVSLEV